MENDKRQVLEQKLKEAKLELEQIQSSSATTRGVDKSGQLPPDSILTSSKLIEIQEAKQKVSELEDALNDLDKQ